MGKYTRPQNCAFSDIFGTDLTRRVVALCMGIAICHRQKFEQVWGFPAPYQKLQENSAAGIPYTYIAVTFQLRSSINVSLTLYNRVCTKRSPKMWFWGDFGGRGKDVWWESASVLRIARF